MPVVKGDAVSKNKTPAPTALYRCWLSCPMGCVFIFLPPKKNSGILERIGQWTACMVLLLLLALTQNLLKYLVHCLYEYVKGHEFSADGLEGFRRHLSVNY